MTSGSLPSRRAVLRATTAASGTACALALAGCSAEPPDVPRTGPSAIPSTGTAVPVGTVAELPVGSGASSTTSNGTPVVVYRPDAGRVLAYSAICTHAGCTVAPQGAAFVCPCHGSTFNALDGTVTVGPATRALPRYAASIEGTQIIVKI